MPTNPTTEQAAREFRKAHGIEWGLEHAMDTMEQAEAAYDNDLAALLAERDVMAKIEAAKMMCRKCRDGDVPESDGWHWVTVAPGCRQGEMFCAAWPIIRDQLTALRAQAGESGE
jgi:hypothetical protein